MRILMGLTEIAGYYSSLRKGFGELGIKCDFIDLSDHPFQYRDDSDSVWMKLIKYISKKRGSTSRSKILLKIFWVVVQQVVWCCFLFKYDVFIFGYKSSLWRFRELPILKLLNKKVVYVFHGSDSRPAYIDGVLMALDRGLTIEDCIKLAAKQKAVVKTIESYANIIVGNPLSSHFHEKQLISGAFIGLPSRMKDTDSREPNSGRNQRIRIVHAPSHPESKGTAKIRQAIRRLQANGYEIGFVELTGKSNSVVLDELARCDFVIDQLYSDTLMAGFAMEAAFLGKPAIVGGYAEKEIPKIFSDEMMPPVHYCHPDTIESSIEKLILDENYRIELGKRAKQFVQSNWTAKKVAERYLKLIEGSIPKEWTYNPKQIHYLHGAGLPEHSVKQLVRAVIEEGGREALQLADKPELEKMFLQFAYAESSH